MKKILFILFLLVSVSADAQELKAFEQDGLWGYKGKGEIVIQPQFQYALDFQFHKGVVLKGEKVGLINAAREIVVPFEYDMIHLLNDSLVRIANKAVSYGDYNVGVITDSGKEVLPILFSSVYLRAEKFFVEKRRDSLIVKGEHAGWTSRKSSYGIYSLTGKPILEPIYDRFKWIGDSLLRVSQGRYRALAKPNGQFLTDLKYTAFGDFYNDRSKIRIDSSYGFLDRNGHEVISPRFKLVSAFYLEMANYRKDDGKVGFINIQGDEIFESDYEILKYPHLGCAAARKKGKWGMISITGKVLVPFKYDDYIREFEGVIAFKRKDKWAIFSPKGTRLTGYEFDSIQVRGSKESSTRGYYSMPKGNKYNQAIAIVMKGGQSGVVNMDGELIIPFGLSPQKLNEELGKLKIR